MNNRKAIIKARGTSGCRLLDELGGVAPGGLTLLAGPTGSGKTRAALEFILRGAVGDEPGVFFSFQDAEDTIVALAAELGFDLARMLERGQVAFHCGRVERQAGFAVDLQALYARLDAAVKTTRARRIALDGLDRLLERYFDAQLCRSETRRLGEWVRERGLTALVTERRPPGSAPMLEGPGVHKAIFFRDTASVPSSESLGEI